MHKFYRALAIRNENNYLYVWLSIFSKPIGFYGSAIFGGVIRTYRCDQLTK